MIEWWGKRSAINYCNEFHARVMDMLGWRLIDQNQRMYSLRCFISAVKYQPRNLKFYYGLLSSIIGKKTSQKLVKFIKNDLLKHHD